MGFFYITPEAKAAIAAIVEHAHKPETVRHARGTTRAIQLGTYDCAFSVVENDDGIPFRVLTVKCMLGIGASVNRTMLVEIGKEFGFRDPYTRDGWLVVPCDCGCGAITVWQRVEPPPPEWVGPS